MPATEEAMVTRWRLIDALEKASPGSLVLVVAAAGYGKTTLLRQWSETSSRASVVVSASPEQDAVELATAIAERVADVLPAAAPLLERAREAEVDWACDLVPDLLALAAAQPLALAIDDTHALTTPSSREMIGVLAASWPAPSVLVLSGRTRPPVPLVRDVLAAPVVAIGERELDFDEPEIEEFRKASRAAVDREELVALTGGWPAGIRLAALVRDEDLLASATSVEGYLRDQVLSSFTAHELDYLGHVATLSPAPATTIDRILQRDDTLETMRSLAERGLPMVQVPSTADEPIVVHALLAQVLLDRLDERSAGTASTLVDLAVDVCQRSGDYTYAFGLLDRHGRGERFRTMPYLFMFPLVSNGRTGELRSWMEHFDPDDRVADPLLVFPYANVARPRDEGQVRAMFRGHDQDRTTVLPDGISPALACERMLTAFGLAPANPDDTELLGGWRQTHGMTRAWDLYSDDRVEEAEHVLESLRNSAHKYPVTNAVGLAKLAIIALETGRSDLAAERAAEASHIVTEARMEETTLGFIVDAVNLKLARRARALDDAEQIARGARRKMAAVGDGTMLERATTLLELGLLAVDLGYPPSVGESVVAEVQGITGRWPSTSRLDRQCAQLADRLATSPPPEHPRDGDALLTNAELRVLRYLPSHLTLPLIADQLGVSHSTVRSQCQAVYRKLGAATREQAVTAAKERGLLN